MDFLLWSVSESQSETSKTFMPLLHQRVRLAWQLSADHTISLLMMLLLQWLAQETICNGDAGQQGIGFQLSSSLLSLCPSALVVEWRVHPSSPSIKFWPATKSRCNTLYYSGELRNLIASNSYTSIPYVVLGFLFKNPWLLGAALFRQARLF